jgi:hypothetical protein
MSTVIDIPKSYYHSIEQINGYYYLVLYDHNDQIVNTYSIKADDSCNLYIRPILNTRLLIDHDSIDLRDEYNIEVNGTSFSILIDSEAGHMIYRKTYLLCYL